MFGGFRCGCLRSVDQILEVLAQRGAAAALRSLQSLLNDRPDFADPVAQPLLSELMLRLTGAPGPRILVDGIWLSRSAGGITRVWEQILRFWSLPGLVGESSPVCIIDRESTSALVSRFETLEMTVADPLALDHLQAISHENSGLASQWKADVFLSTWITTCGASQPSLPELILVHDCMPERSQAPSPLLQQRRRWLLGASGLLAVSSATAQDVEGLLKLAPETIPWCHPAPAPCFLVQDDLQAADRLWDLISERVGLAPPFVVLPATSAIGSYKNPELVAEALSAPPLSSIQLVICGVAADQHARSLEEHWPRLAGRIRAVGFTDLELAEVYRRALAVVIPSRIEGFGLPAVEALAVGATVLVANSRGLREAAGSAAPRFDSDRADQLAAWLQLLLDDSSRAWVSAHLQRRGRDRLAELNPHLIGLALLAQARRISAPQPAS